MSVNFRVSLGSSLALFLLACAHTPPEELLQARAAYQRAAEGPSKDYTPAGLHVAKNSLQLAERSFRNNEDTWLIRAQSYVALRKAELAESLARAEMYQRDVTDAEKRKEELEDQIMKQTKAELADVTQELQHQQASEVRSAEQLAAEKTARAEAEMKAARATAELQRLGSVSHDARGTVVTLSGSVLFASGKDVLLPAAKSKLDEVAEALLAGDPDTSFVVEGHTDSQGSGEKNKTLSLSRANAVRDYLITREIASDRITTEGYGEERPIAENSNPEGRANNRRVEIVIKPNKG